MLDRALRQRYSRQTMFPGIGDEGQVKLAKGSVVIIGCGALGTNIANYLVRAGVGKVRIVDRDFIEIHNLQRQVLFTEEDIKDGLPKAIAAKRYLSKVNSSIEIEAIVADANYTNIEKFCTDTDVILDGLDNFETRFLINDVSLKHKIPWVYGGAIASRGMTMTVIPGKTPCFRCLTPSLPEAGTTPTCETAGVVGTIPSIIGALQATEAMKLLIGAEINHELVTIDVWKNAFYHLKIEPREDCPACQGKYEFLEDKYDMKTSSFCGQSRAIQVVSAKVNKINLNQLAAKLEKAGEVTHNEYMLRFNIKDGENEIVVFPDGRAIVRNTIDETLAKELYTKYIGDLR